MLEFDVGIHCCSVRRVDRCDSLRTAVMLKDMRQEDTLQSGDTNRKQFLLSSPVFQSLGFVNSYVQIHFRVIAEASGAVCTLLSWLFYDDHIIRLHCYALCFTCF